MQDNDQKQKTTAALDYDSPKNNPKKPWPLKAKIAVLVIALFVFSMAILMPLEIVKLPFKLPEIIDRLATILLLSVVGIIIASLSVYFFSQMVRFICSRKKDQGYSEEDDEKEWQAREGSKREMVEIANHIYANGPIGNWRFTAVEYRRTLPIVLEDRVVTFEMNGKGRYIWRKRGDDSLVVETLFEFKLERTGHILVQISSPPVEGWNSVEFGFESRPDKGSDLDLFVWFEGDNPLPSDFKEHWPFWGDYQRSTN